MQKGRTVASMSTASWLWSICWSVLMPTPLPVSLCAGDGAGQLTYVYPVFKCAVCVIRTISYLCSGPYLVDMMTITHYSLVHRVLTIIADNHTTCNNRLQKPGVTDRGIFNDLLAAGSCQVLCLCLRVQTALLWRSLVMGMLPTSLT